MVFRAHPAVMTMSIAAHNIAQIIVYVFAAPWIGLPDTQNNSIELCFSRLETRASVSASGLAVHFVHFFLDFRRKEPYKGDTSARS